MDFGCQNGDEITPKWIQNSIWIVKHRFLGIDRFTAGFIAEFDYKDAGKVDFWDPKSMKNRSQNDVGQGRRPGIDF